MIRQPQLPASGSMRRKKEGPDISLEGLLSALFMSVLMFAYYAILPVFVFAVVNWIVFLITQDTYYHEPWMLPALLMAGVFLSGAIIRMNMEDQQGSGLGLFLLSILGLIAFAYLTWLDVEHGGGIYSKFLPRILKPSAQDYILALPAVGMVGMLVFKNFSLKNYS